MARAVLEIAADTSGIEAAFGRLRTEAQRLEQQMRVSFSAASQQGARAYRDSARTQAAEARRGAQASEREAHRAVLAFVRGEEQKRRAATLTTANQQRAEAEATRVAQDEARKRGLTAEQEARVRTTALHRLTREFEREERQQTRIAQREARARAEAPTMRQRVTAAAVNVAEGVVSQGAQGASSLHQQLQDARRTRASIAADFDRAAFQAGVNRAESDALFQSITQFAQDRSFSSPEIVSALNAVQGEFSVLAGTTPQARTERLNEQLQVFAMAKAAHIENPEEVLRLSALFQTQGYNAEQRRTMTRFAIGSGEQGAIEAGALTRQAMPALTSRMNMARSRAAAGGANADAQAVAAAREMQQFMSELQVARRISGASPREAGNALRNFTQALGSNVTQDKLLQNIRVAMGQGSAIEQRLYERDPTRAQGLRLRSDFTNALNLMEVFQQEGVSSEQFQNLTRGGGPGNAMSALSNERRILGTMLAPGAIEAVRNMMSPATAISEERLRSGAAMYAGSEQARLTKEEETRLNVLTQNTDALMNLSKRFETFAAEHPVATTLGLPVLSAGLGSAATMAFQAIRNRVLPAAATLAETGSGAVTSLATGARNVAPTLARGARAANPVGLLTTLLSFGGAFSGTDFQQSQRRSLEGFVAGAAPDRQAITRRAGESLIQQGQAITAESIGRAVAQALRENPPTATVSPTDAQHAATQAAPAAGRR